MNGYIDGWPRWAKKLQLTLVPMRHISTPAPPAIIFVLPI